MIEVETELRDVCVLALLGMLGILQCVIYHLLFDRKLQIVNANAKKSSPTSLRNVYNTAVRRGGFAKDQCR